MAYSLETKKEVLKRMNKEKIVDIARVFTGFLNKLKNCKEEIEEIFENLVQFMYENLEGFGKIVQ